MKKYLAIILMSSCISNLNGMSFGRTALGCTAVMTSIATHHYIAADKMYGDSAEWAKAYRYGTYMSGEEAPPLIRDFVHKVLAREGIHEPSAVKIYVGPDTDGTAEAGAYHNFRGIKLKKSFATALSNTLTNQVDQIYNTYGDKKMSLTNAEFLAFARGTTVHEADHITRHYVAANAFAQFAIPIITTTCCWLISAKQLFDKPVSTVKLTGGLIVFALAGIGTREINELLFKKICRVQEQWADDAVMQPDEIEARLHFFKFLDDSPPQDTWERIRYTYESLHSTHPRNHKRAARYDQRLQAMRSNKHIDSLPAKR